MKEMRTTEKLIITVSPSSNFQGKEANPALPYSPEEIADTVYECWNEGASIAHIHCRDKEGVPSNDPEVFREVDRLIRERMRHHYPAQHCTRHEAGYNDR